MTWHLLSRKEPETGSNLILLCWSDTPTGPWTTMAHYHRYEEEPGEFLSGAGLISRKIIIAWMRFQPPPAEFLRARPKVSKG